MKTITPSKLLIDFTTSNQQLWNISQNKKIEFKRRTWYYQQSVIVNIQIRLKYRHRYMRRHIIRLKQLTTGLANYIQVVNSC